jgi:hypothetical protein
MTEGAPESTWQANARRLSEIAAMSGLGREMHAAESERLEAEQDAIEFEIGKPEGPPRRWSGAR